MALRPAHRRDLAALALLAPLLVAIAYAAATVPWHSNANNVDNRTHLQMIDGVARHGLPWIENGWPERFPEMRAQWFYYNHGRLWGTYPPVFTYVALPFYRWGGAHRVIQFNIALLGLLALGVFALGRRFLRDARLGAAAAYVVLVCAPGWTMAHDTSPYVLANTLIAWCMYFALGALDEARRSHGNAALAGLAGGLAVGTHLYAFPVLAPVLLLLTLLPADDGATLAPFASPRAREWLPTRGSFMRGAWALGGAAVPLALVGALNHVRFDTWSPITYGPCPWRSCVENGAIDQTPRAMLAFAAPTIAWVAVAAGLAHLVRRVPRARWAVVVAAVLLLAPESEIHRRTFLILAVLCGFILDASQIPIRPPYHRAADGLGNFLGPYVLKSTVQGTPALALALLAPGGSAARRRAIALLAAPSAAVYLLFALRANMPSEHAIGFSYLHFRYAMPAVPMLSVLALSAARELPWRRAHVALALVAAAALGAWLARYPSDADPARRWYLLRGTLALAAGAFVLAALARVRPRGTVPQAAVLVTALAFASGAATTVSVDLVATFRDRAAQDARLDAVASRTPARFGLIGWALELNQVLALSVRRDVQFADLYEAEGWGNGHEIIERWIRDGRPVYGLFAVPVPPSPWPDLAFRPVDLAQGLVRIDPVVPAPGPVVQP